MGEVYTCGAGEVLAAGRAYVSPYWSALPAGWTTLISEWAAVDRPLNGIGAFSSGALDSLGGYFYLFGGGHQDYWGNDVWRANLETLAWQQMYAPDIGYNPTIASVEGRVDYINQPGAFVDTQRPISRHTYYSVAWREATGELYAGGGSTYSGSGDYLWDINGGPWHNSPRDHWRYNPVTNSWVYLGSSLLDATMLRAIAVYDRRTDMMYNITRRTGDSRWVTQTFNPVTGASAQLGGLSTRADTEFPIALDEYRDCLWALSSATGGPHLVKYDLTTEAFSEVATTGTKPPLATGHGMAYVSHLDRLYVIASDGVYWINPDDAVWVKTSDADKPPNTANVMGRWRYDRRRKVLFLASYGGSGGSYLRLSVYKPSA